MLNRSSKYGRFALKFNSDIEEAALEEDYDKLGETCQEASYPELDSLSKESRAQWEDGMDSEILSLNMFVDTELLKGGKDERNNLENCYGEVCTFKTKQRANYVKSESAHVITLSELRKFGKKKREAVYVWNFRELDLVFLLVSGKPNPRTKSPLPQHTLFGLTKKYSDEILMCRHSSGLGYDHAYRF